MSGQGLLRLCKKKKDGTIIITADHGNAEQMVDYITGEHHTAHTKTTLCLFILVSDKKHRCAQWLMWIQQCCIS